MTDLKLKYKNINMKNTLFKALYESAKILKEYFGRGFKIESKDVISNLVTEVDKKSEEKIIEIIKKDFPEHDILSEEVGKVGTASDTKWIIDPIDGTINYAHSIPLCCISIGIEYKGEILMGGVFNPFSDEMFFSEKGKGAFLNNREIRVSDESELSKSLLVTGFPYDPSKNPNSLKTFAEFLSIDVPVRRLGSAALDICWTACGRFDGFWEFNLNPWDVSAGYLILKEAGGMVTDFKGNNYSIYSKQILATNGKIHDQMLTHIKKAIEN